MMKKYCSYCGRELVSKILLDGSTEKYCVECDHVFFEEPSPAVIVAVMNGGKVLLTRSVGWKHDYWGLVAGHVKSGENAEEAALREVKEEVGIDVLALEIVGTYAIKDRNLLMIGFQAKTDSMKIKKSQELEMAKWFQLSDNLPLRPGSVASQIVYRIKDEG